MEPTLAFRAPAHEAPSLEVRVNFGVFAGRQVTNAEIDDLALALSKDLAAFTIVAEERHEFGDAVEASLHQVVIELDGKQAGDDLDATAATIVATADRWAAACIASRHSPLSD